MKYILFSHGFGVKKDSRGMFTDIASAFPDYEAVMFDYNRVSNAANEVIVEPYSSQAMLLDEELHGIYSSDSNAEVTLIGHSQGCIIPCLITGIKISKAILLAPPKVLGSKNRRDNQHEVSDNGDIKIPRKDGTTTIVTKSFIDELETTQPVTLYSELAKSVNTYMVIAKQDEIIRDHDFSMLADQIAIHQIDGDHNFTGMYRKGLLETLSELLI